MKLLIALVVVSSVMLKVQGGAIAAYAGACTPASDTCDVVNSECRANAAGVTQCLCKMNYVAISSLCKLAGGQPCTDATKANCASGVCTSDSKCEGPGANDVACYGYGECKYGSCYAGKCRAGASAIVASLALMLTTLVTTRFL